MKTPMLIFDDLCPFCLFVARLLYKLIGHKVIIIAVSDFPCQRYNIEAEKVEGHPHYLEEPHGPRWTDHEAVSHTLAHLPLCGWFTWRGLNWFWRIVYYTMKKVRNYSM